MGSLAAAAGAVLPPFLIILFLSPLIIRYSDVPAVMGFFRGVLAGTSAIILLVIADNVKSALWGKWWNIVPYMLVVSTIGVFHVHPFAAMAGVLALQYVHEKAAAR